jgi:hypothetical protein
MATTHSTLEGCPSVQGTPKLRDTITNRGDMGGVSLPPKSGGQGDENMKETVTPVAIVTRNPFSFATFLLGVPATDGD